MREKFEALKNANEVGDDKAITKTTIEIAELFMLAVESIDLSLQRIAIAAERMNGDR